MCNTESYTSIPSTHFLHCSDYLELRGRLKKKAFSSQQELQVTCHISTGHVGTHDRVRQSKALVDWYCMRYTITWVQNNSSRTTSCIPTEENTQRWINMRLEWLPTHRLRTACMEMYSAGTLKVSKNTWQGKREGRVKYTKASAKKRQWDNICYFYVAYRPPAQYCTSRQHTSAALTLLVRGLRGASVSNTGCCGDIGIDWMVAGETVTHIFCSSCKHLFGIYILHGQRGNSNKHPFK